MSLKERTYSAARWTTLSSIARACTQLIQVAILARLLAPEDFGLMAMVGVILSVAGLFADWGVSNAFIHRQNVTHEQRSSLFWFSVILGAGISLLLVVLSPVLAGIMGDARLTLLLIYISPVYVLSALGQQIRLAAEKELNFRPIAIQELAATVAGFLAAVCAAIAGVGVYALVIGPIVSAVFSAVLAWVMVAPGWRPLWRIKVSEIVPYVGVGGSILANSVINQINLTMDLFLGGRLLGAAQIGIYSLPRNLVLQMQAVINPIVTRVSFPLIAMMQSDAEQTRKIYLKTLNMVSSANAPLYVAMAIFAPDMVAALLGDKWHEAVPMLRILAVWGLVRSLLNPVGSLLFGLGHANLALKWNFALLMFYPVSLWAGAQYGVHGLAWALLILSLLAYFPAWYFLVWPLCQAKFVEYTVVQVRPVLLALASISPAYLLAEKCDGALVRLVVAGVIAVPLYWIASNKFNREWVMAMRELLRF